MINKYVFSDPFFQPDFILLQSTKFVGTQNVQAKIYTIFFLHFTSYFLTVHVYQYFNVLRFISID